MAVALRLRNSALGVLFTYSFTHTLFHMCEPVSQREFFKCMKVASSSLLLFPMPSLWSRWADPAETDRTQRKPGPWSWWREQWSKTACSGCWRPLALGSMSACWFCGGRHLLPGFLRMPHSIAGPVRLHWTVTLSWPPCFHSTPTSHITDFVERIIMFTQHCICRRLRTLFRFEHWQFLLRSAFQHTSLPSPLFFLSWSNSMLPSAYGLSPCAENPQPSITGAA